MDIPYIDSRFKEPVIDNAETREVRIEDKIYLGSPANHDVLRLAISGELPPGGIPLNKYKLAFRLLYTAFRNVCEAYGHKSLESTHNVVAYAIAAAAERIDREGSVLKYTETYLAPK